MRPLISIILITYNRASLLPESIDSIVGQTYTNWELIIVDDGSTDETLTVIQRYDDPRIIFHPIPRSGKLGFVRNQGIRMAKGTFIAFQDSDDVWTRDKLARQMAYFQEYPEAQYALSSNSQFGQNAVDPPEYHKHIEGRLFRTLLIDRAFHFCASSLIFRQAVVKDIGMLEEQTPRMRELEYFYRMSYRSPGVFLKDRHVKVRRHAGNTSNGYSQDAHQTLSEMIQSFLKKGMIARPEYDKLQCQILYTSGLDYLKTKQYRDAMQAFKKIAETDRSDFKSRMRIFQCRLLSFAKV